MEEILDDLEGLAAAAREEGCLSNQSLKALVGQLLEALLQV